MPASRSPKPSTKPPRRSYAWLIAIGLVSAVAFLAAFLPASLALRFMPAGIEAGDASGTLWHGSFASLHSRGRDYGAVEWRLHPGALLRARVSATVRWVKLDFVVDAELEASKSGVAAHQVTGGGSLESLADLGLTHGWSGTAKLALEKFVIIDQKIRAAAGTLSLSGLKSAQFQGANLGGFEISFPADAVQPDGSAVAQVHDDGGPLQLQGTLSLVPAQGVANFTGTLKERGALPDALRQPLDNLLQLRGRDAQGRIPLDIEFSI